MPYDFFLESENEQRMFKQETLEEMKGYLKDIPHYKVNQRLYYVFKDNEWKNVAVPGILSKIADNKNIYTHPCIVFKPNSIIISVVGDNDVDRYLYNFVVWSQKRYPSSLYSESGKLVPPEDLLDEEEEIPLID